VTGKSSVVFLFDVDDTLLDNDRIIADLKTHLTQVFGRESQRRYWKIFEQRRRELGYADYLGTLQRFRVENVRDPHFLKVSLFLTDYPFANRIYPQALDVLDKFGSWGPTVILTDGDVVFQPRKIWRSGLYEAVGGHALIYIHKESELLDVEVKYPARHYVLVDDKLRILNQIKKIWGCRVTTIFPRQGHYAHDQKILSKWPPADITIDRIGDLMNFDLSTLLASAEQGKNLGQPVEFEGVQQ
jgi:hypothetical protein